MASEKIRECMVCVASYQIDAAGEEQTMKIKSKGQLTERDSVLYVLYEENMEEGQEKMGANTLPDRAAVKNLLKIETESVRVSLKKSGMVSWNIVFEQGKKKKSEYGTPYGSLEIGVETKGVRIRKDGKKTSLQLMYALFIQDEKQADCRLEIEISPDYFT